MNPPVQQSNLRRSARARHPTSYGQALQNASAQATNNSNQTQRRRRVSKTALNRLIANIYEEIHRAAIRETQNGRYATQELLFQARVCRFFDLLAPSDRIALVQTLQDYDVHDFRAGSVANEIKQARLITYQSRLIEFCKDSSLLLLAICAHSQSFRESITGSDQSVARGKPRWSDMYPIIKDCASSLELFALSRPNFDPLRNLQAWNKHFSTTLEWVFKEYTTGILKGTNATNFGIEANDLTPVHHITDELEDKVHHHWVLRQEQQPAVRAEIEYTVTEDMLRADFVNDYDTIAGRSRKGKGRKKASPVPLTVGSLQKLKQLNIEKSVVLPNHPWPPGRMNNVHGVPDFCGDTTTPCIVCEAVDPGDTVNVGPDGLALPFALYPCHCTFKDLLKSKTAFNDPKDVLVELYTTDKTGVGVRALQRIPKGVFIGAYFGEIYPGEDNQTGEYIVRYGKPKGDVYHFSVCLDNNDSGFVVDAGHLGNWTRYMNHSCRPNVTFSTKNVGQRCVVLVQTERVINFGDALLVDYGEDYFNAQKLNCLCGEEKCQFKDKFPSKNATTTAAKRAASSDQDSDSDSTASLPPPKKRMKTMASSKGTGKGSVTVLIPTPIQTARKTIKMPTRKTRTRQAKQATGRATKRGR